MFFLKSNRKKKIEELKGILERLPNEKDHHKSDGARYIVDELKKNDLQPEEIGTSHEKLNSLISQGIEEMARYIVEEAKRDKIPLNIKEIKSKYFRGAPGWITDSEGARMVIEKINEILASKRV